MIEKKLFVVVESKIQDSFNSVPVVLAGDGYSCLLCSFYCLCVYNYLIDSIYTVIDRCDTGI